MSDDMPDQPKTQQMPAADKTDISIAELKTLVINGFRAVKLDMNAQGGQIGVIQKQLDILFEWKGGVEERLKNNSQRAAATSDIDLDHEAKIAATIVKTEQLETAIHETRAIVAEQSRFMGIGKQGLAWLRSKDGRADVIRIATLIGVAYATLKQAGVLK